MALPGLDVALVDLGLLQRGLVGLDRLLDAGDLLVHQRHHLLDRGLGGVDLVEAEGDAHDGVQPREVLAELHHLVAAGVARPRGAGRGLLLHRQQLLERVAVGHLHFQLAAGGLDLLDELGDLRDLLRVLGRGRRLVAVGLVAVVGQAGQESAQLRLARGQIVLHRRPLAVARHTGLGVGVLHLAQQLQALGVGAGVLEVVQLGQLVLGVGAVGLAQQIGPELLVFLALAVGEGPPLGLELGVARLQGLELFPQAGREVARGRGLVPQVAGVGEELLQARLDLGGRQLVQVGIEGQVLALGAPGVDGHDVLGVEGRDVGIQEMRHGIGQVEAEVVLDVVEHDVAPGDGAAERDHALARRALHGRAEVVEQREAAAGERRPCPVRQAVELARVAHDALDLRADGDHAEPGLGVGAPEVAGLGRAPGRARDLGRGEGPARIRLAQRLQLAHHGPRVGEHRREDGRVEHGAEHQVAQERLDGDADDRRQPRPDERHGAHRQRQAVGHAHEQRAQHGQRGQRDRQQRDAGDREPGRQRGQPAHRHGRGQGQRHAPLEELEQRPAEGRQDVAVERAVGWARAQSDERGMAGEAAPGSRLLESRRRVRLRRAGTDEADEVLVLVEQREADVAPEVAQQEHVEEVIRQAHEEAGEVLVELGQAPQPAAPARLVRDVGEAAVAAPTLVLLRVAPFELLAVEALQRVVRGQPSGGRAGRR